MNPWLAHSARRHPGRTALYVDDRQREISYGRLADEVGRRAAVISDVTGDTDRPVVALLAPNSEEWLKLAHAVLWLGGTLVPLNPKLSPQDWTGQIASTRPDLVIHDGSLDGRIEHTETRRVDDLAAGAEEVITAAPPVPLEDDAVATIFFTSGTTGQPKAVPLTYGNHASSAMASAYNLGVLPKDRWLAPLPLFHVGGLAIALRCAIYGSAIDMMTEFDPDRAAERLSRDSVTLASFVPTMLRRIFDSPRFDGAPDLRAALLGGGPTDASLADRCRTHGFPALQTWGMTETSSQLATHTPGDETFEPGQVGPPLHHAEITILDDQGRDMGAGCYGEIAVRGPSVFEGYIPLGDETDRNDANQHLGPLDRSAFTEDGWFRTGDVGLLTAGGQLVVDTRKSARIVTGGENVDPVEVESVLRRHPRVLDACVVGLDDSEWGQRVGASVEWEADDGAATEPSEDASDTQSTWRQQLEAHCRERLAGFKCPRIWHRTDSLPKTGSHKIDRRAVRHLVASHGTETP
mgnify:CR=1 FL=1